jgi:hypothetical protein
VLAGSAFTALVCLLRHRADEGRPLVRASPS